MSVSSSTLHYKHPSLKHINCLLAKLVTNKAIVEIHTHPIHSDPSLLPVHPAYTTIHQTKRISSKNQQLATFYVPRQTPLNSLFINTSLQIQTSTK
jgi:hypothetical protein